jgi:hypothetical protein
MPRRKNVDPDPEVKAPELVTEETPEDKPEPADPYGPIEGAVGDLTVVKEAGGFRIVVDETKRKFKQYKRF